jgi:hypothetical protein
VIAVTGAGFRRTEIRDMQHDRIRTSIPVEIRIGGRVSEGIVRNASDGGMFVETRTIPPQGESVSLRFAARSETKHDVVGLVWWTTQSTPNPRRRGFGVRLLEDHTRYSQMLDGLRGSGGASTQRITASQRRALAASYEALRDSEKSRGSR